MAANTSPIFVLSAFSSGYLPVSVSTANADVDGSSGSFTTIVTGGTNGSIVTQIIVRAVTNTKSGTTLYFYYNSGGTRFNIGHLVVSGGIDPSKGMPCWEGIWQTYMGDGFPLKSGDKIDIAPFNGDSVYHCRAIGGDL